MKALCKVLSGRMPALVGTTLLLSACGGASEALDTQATTSPAPPATTEVQLPHVQEPPPRAKSLVGTWSLEGDRLLARFGHNGKFAIDTSDLDAPYTQGTYEVEGKTIRFTAANTGSCLDVDWTWEAGLSDDDDPLESELHIVVVESGCQVPVGTEWTFARLSLE